MISSASATICATSSAQLAHLVDQALRLAGPPHAAVHVALAEHLGAAARAGGQLGDVVEGRAGLALDLGDLVGDRVRATRAVLWNLRNTIDGVALVVGHDLLLDVLVDRRLGRWP